MVSVTVGVRKVRLFICLSEDKRPVRVQEVTFLAILYTKPPTELAKAAVFCTEDKNKTANGFFCTNMNPPPQALFVFDNRNIQFMYTTIT